MDVCHDTTLHVDTYVILHLLALNNDNMYKTPNTDLVNVITMCLLSTKYLSEKVNLYVDMPRFLFAHFYALKVNFSKNLVIAMGV